MNSFARPSFFRLFDQLISSTNPQLNRARWTIDGVEAERERHSFAGPDHGVAIEAAGQPSTAHQAAGPFATDEPDLSAGGDELRPAGSKTSASAG